MGAHLVTGYAGKEHITSADQGIYNAGTIGKGKYVLETGRMFECEQINSNLVKIHSGDLMNQGRHITISADDYVECTIDNGLQGLKRNDLIVMRYSKNKDTDIENAEVVVLKGTSGETATDPDYLTGDILNGDMEDDFLLYRIKLNGIEVESVEPLFNVILSASKAQKKIEEVYDYFLKKYQELDKETDTNYNVLNTLISGKAPANHTSPASSYGLGTGANYGHVKVINALTDSTYSDGRALSAYQGKVLNDKISDIYIFETVEYKTSVSANDTVYPSLTLPQHSGYSPVVIAGYQGLSGKCVMIKCVLSGQSAYLGIHNYGTSSASLTLELQVIYLKRIS